MTTVISILKERNGGVKEQTRPKQENTTEKNTKPFGVRRKGLQCCIPLHMDIFIFPALFAKKTSLSTERWNVIYLKKNQLILLMCVCVCLGYCIDLCYTVSPISSCLHYCSFVVRHGAGQCHLTAVLLQTLLAIFILKCVFHFLNSF